MVECEIVGPARPMTRRAALTVRLPGASTMPATSASTCSQTGAVKKLRKGAISEMMIGGIGAATVDEEGERCWVIATLESVRVELSLCLQKSGRGILNRRLWGQADDSCAPNRYHRPMSLKDDDIIRLIENFKFDAGPVAVERRNRGFTLIHAETGVPIARLRPIGRDDLVDILY